MTPTLVLPITEISQVAHARREVEAAARAAGFSDAVIARIALVVTEIATNLIKHVPRGGTILLGTRTEPELTLDLLALDRGPGMSDVRLCLRDGYSTRGSAGGGLGAIRRLADTFDMLSLPERGTTLLASFRADPRRPLLPETRVAALCLPYPGEREPGDAWAVEQRDGRTVVLVVDGLGHGPRAAAAARRAVETFQGRANRSPAHQLEALHAALHGTVGAVAGIAALEPHRRQVVFAGLGNINAFVLLPSGRHALISHNGTLGIDTPRIQEFSCPWTEEAVLILHSDGCTARWDATPYPGLLGRHPLVIAGILVRDGARNNDDVTVLVARGAAWTPCY